MNETRGILAGTVAIGSGVIFICFIRRKWNYWKNKGIEGPPPSFLGLGNTIEGQGFI